MATESQFDAWRRDIATNLRKAVEAGQQRAEESSQPIIHPSDRMKLSLAAAQVTGQVMIAERIGQLVQGLNHSDEQLAEATDRVRTGEQILGRLIEFIEAEEIEVGEEADVFVTMAEDWLTPDGPVGFASPEAVEAGVDPHSRPPEEEPEDVGMPVDEED